MGLKMKASVLDELVKRLRSGEYMQGQSALRLRGYLGKPDSYCCLGVLCEMAVEAGVVDRSPANGNDGTYWYGNDESGSNIYLPGAVVDWAGIVSDIEKELSMSDYFYEQRGTFGESKQSSLAVMNDEGEPFPEIADWLVENVERV